MLVLWKTVCSRPMVLFQCHVLFPDWTNCYVIFGLRLPTSDCVVEAELSGGTALNRIAVCSPKYFGDGSC